MTKRNMLIVYISRHLVFNIITSKLYTSSLLSSLNSRLGWGYDTSENNDGEFDLGTYLGLRFASNSQSTAASDRTSASVVITTPPVSSDRTSASVVITTPPVSPILFSIMTGYIYHQDFVPGERPSRLTKLARSEGQFCR